MPTVSEMPEHGVESPSVAREDQYGEFIDERLDRTSFHLKTLDLVTGLIWLGLAVFGSLLILVLVDHWIVGFSVWARFLSLAAITSVSLYLAIRRVLMPMLRSINPEYAALTVEHAHPELKNGLISFLFFREHPDQLRQGVYQGIQQQAASDLTVVPIDSAVDRSAIIRLGYCLVALAVVWVGYILLSPKNPLQTVQRIAMPWRDIARPSQVDILEVTPGNIEVFRGQSVEIKTKVEGLKSGESPSILFSTLDGQLVNQHIVLASNGNAGRYSGMLTTSGSGIQQDLEYRIRAGDAMSQRYEVQVTEAPHILVDRLKFDYPSYTGQADEIVQGEGDIRAIEGTRITVVGKANQLIQRGHIDFLQSDATLPFAPKRASLKVKNSPTTEAEVQFPLRMNAERNAALYRGYRLEFTNETGQTSVDPIEHTIDVIPDLRPVVQILTPEQRTIELPENSWQQIEVRAVDPDFKLSRVQLAARTRGRNLFKENLLTTTRASEWRTGQFIASYRFVPRDFGLQDGDVVEYLAVAEDNRHALTQNKLDPNRTITAKQYIRIVKSDPVADEPPRDNTSNSEDRPHSEAQDQAEKSEGSNDQQPQSEKDQQSQGDSNAEQKQQGEKGSQGEEGDQSEQQESGDSENSESGLQQNSDKGGGETQEQSEGGSPGESSDSNSERESQGQSSGDRSTDQANENSLREKNDQPQDSNGDSISQNEGETGENPGQGNPDAKQGESGELNRNSSDDNGGQGAGEDEPLPSSGERDGEVVERIREHMEKNGDLEQYEQKQQEKQETDGGEAGSRDETDTGSSQQPSEQKQDATGTDQSHSNPNESGDGEGDDPPSAGKEGSQQQTSGEQDSKQQDPKNGASRTNEQPIDDASKDSDNGKSDSGKKGDAESQGTRPGEEPAEQGSETGESTKPRDPTESSGDPATKDRPNESQESGEPSTGESETEGPQNGQDNDSGEDSPKSQGEKGAEKGDTKPSSEQTESESNQPSDQPSESEADSGKAEGTSQDSQASKSKPSNTSKPKGASETGDSQSTAGADANDTATGDDANLEYARKATDLVLEYLRDQDQRPDQELLDKLGWKKDDVDKFVRRWDEMKRNAEGSDQVSQQKKSKLDEMLKGMGLESPNAKLRRSTNQDDRQRDNRNTGRKRKVPTELLDPFRAFQRGLQQKK